MRFFYFFILVFFSNNSFALECFVGRMDSGINEIKFEMPGFKIPNNVENGSVLWTSDEVNVNVACSGGDFGERKCLFMAKSIQYNNSPRC